VTLGKVPATLVLGLLASLAAHAGGGHVMGGAYHELLAQGALGAAICLLLFFGALAWCGSQGVTDGSVLAVRLRARLPGIGLMLAGASLWYAAIEAIEPHHAGPAPLATLAAVAVLGWLVLRFARAAIDILAGAVITVLRISFTPRTPSWKRRPRSRPVRRLRLRARRRFARPPPIAIACA
jgi:hypothetical protein